MFNKVQELHMSAEDISRTYNDGYVGWKTDDGQIVPVYVENGHGTSRIRLANIGRVSLNSERLILEHPDSGYAIHRGELLYIQRVAQRQWHRCIRDRCVVILHCSRSTTARISVGEVAEYLYKTDFPIAANGITIYGRKFAEDANGNVFLHGRCVRAGGVWTNPAIESLFNEVTQ